MLFVFGRDRWCDGFARILKDGNNPEGRVEQQVTEIKLKRGESVDRALRRLKKKMDKEGTLKEIRNHRYFEKPCEKRRRKAARSRFS